MTYILDRLEGGIAVLISADGDTLNTERGTLLCENPKEGDVFELTEDGFVFCKEETKKRRLLIGSRFSRLVNNKRKKDRSEEHKNH